MKAVHFMNQNYVVLLRAFRAAYGRTEKGMELVAVNVQNKTLNV